MSNAYFLAKEGRKIVKKAVFLKNRRELDGTITDDGQGNEVFEGELRISKIFWNAPLVIDGREFKTACEACANRYICWTAANQTNSKDCLNWLASDVCKECTVYKQCYRPSERQCKQMADGTLKGKDYGFILDRTVTMKSQPISALRTTTDMSMKIRMKNRVITWLLKRISKNDSGLYHSWNIPKRNGGVRKIGSPCHELKNVQKAILEHVLYQIPRHPASVGFVPGKSIADNAREHAGSEVLVSMDLEDFFPSITFPRVFGALKKCGLHKRIAGIVTALCTWDKCLPQGAPTSPALSNIVSFRMDKKLSTFFKARGWTYTRYADDITFSTKDKKSAVDGTIKIVRRIVEEENFKINEAKTKIMRKGRRQWVTGLVANEKPNIVRWKFRQIRSAVHNACVMGLEKAAKKQGISTARYKEWVSGHVSFFHMVNKTRTSRLKKKWESIAGGS